jgi:hypothetical protein
VPQNQQALEQWGVLEASSQQIIEVLLSLSQCPDAEGKEAQDIKDLLAVAVRYGIGTPECSIEHGRNIKSLPNLAVEQGPNGGWEFATLSFPFQHWAPPSRVLLDSRRHSPRQAEFPAS